MNLNKRTISIAFAALLLVGGGSAAIQSYMGQTQTDATVENPLTVTVGTDSDLNAEDSFTEQAGDTLTLEDTIKNRADNPAPRVVRVLEISRQGHDYTGIDQVRNTMNVVWRATEYTEGDLGMGTSDVNMLDSTSWSTSDKTGKKAGFKEGDAVICNAHRDSEDGEDGTEYGYLDAGESITEEWDITPDFYDGAATYDIDYRLQESCPL